MKMEERKRVYVKKETDKNTLLLTECSILRVLRQLSSQHNSPLY